MRKLIILGGDGIGMIAADIAELTQSHTIIGFLNDHLPIGSFIGKFKRYPVLGRVDEVQKYLSDAEVDIFIAFVGMTQEEQAFNKIERLGLPPSRRPSLIHPTALYNENMVSIGSGVLMAAYSQLSPDVVLDNYAILLANSFVGHNSKVGIQSHLATNSVVGGYVNIGRFCHIGSNSTIREKVVIEDFVLVGSGSVVLKDCSRGKIYAGNPARLIEK